MHSCLVHYHITHCILFFYSQVNTITKKDKRTLQHPYQTRSKAKNTVEVEDVQEQMKADMEAMKDQMTSMMEAMLSMKWMMENNTAAVAATSAAIDADPTHPFAINQVNQPIPDMVV